MRRLPKPYPVLAAVGADGGPVLHGKHFNGGLVEPVGSSGANLESKPRTVCPPGLTTNAVGREAGQVVPAAVADISASLQRGVGISTLFEELIDQDTIFGAVLRDIRCGYEDFLAHHGVDIPRALEQASAAQAKFTAAMTADMVPEASIGCEGVEDTDAAEVAVDAARRPWHEPQGATARCAAAKALALERENAALRALVQRVRADDVFTVVRPPSASTGRRPPQGTGHRPPVSSASSLAKRPTSASRSASTGSLDPASAAVECSQVRSRPGLGAVSSSAFASAGAILSPALVSRTARAESKESWHVQRLPPTHRPPFVPPLPLDRLALAPPRGRAVVSVGTPLAPVAAGADIPSLAVA